MNAPADSPPFGPRPIHLLPFHIRAFHIRPWAAADQDGVVALISGIQRGEFSLLITPADQPDLMDITGFYRRGAGEFWVAEAARPAPGKGRGCDADGGAGSDAHCDANRDVGGVIGCIALLDIGGGQGALRKMFVHKHWRGTPRGGSEAGVAEALLRTLLEHASARGLGEIFLGTTTRFLAAHRFYEKHGFTRVEKAGLPQSFPVMAVDSMFYRLGLTP